MKIGVLTSSRADYGIYLPLLQRLKKESVYNLQIIAFGMHLSKRHGYTLSEIIKDKYDTIYKIDSLEKDDSKKGIAISYSNTVNKFADFWSKHKFDLIFCLGDRFEMSAAVQASIPFGVKMAHIHGGETTIGAIDNIYRHQISLVAKYHFVSSKIYLKKVSNIIGETKNIYNVGALSLDNINEINLPKWSDVRKLFNIPDLEFILITFHPETVNSHKNKFFTKIIYETLNELCKKYHLVITLANADTMGSLYSSASKLLEKRNSDKITLIDNFGKYNYFSAMKSSICLLGNTSSAILEAASFGKYAINVGERQLGRVRSNNIMDVSYNKSQIINAVNEITKKGKYMGRNSYYKPNTALNIIKIIKENEL